MTEKYAHFTVVSSVCQHYFSVTVFHLAIVLAQSQEDDASIIYYSNQRAFLPIMKTGTFVKCT